MARRYSIAEARDAFAEVVRQAEMGEEAIVTRRGKAVAVIISESSCAALRNGRPAFWPSLLQWRDDLQRDGLDVPADVWEDIRDSSPGGQIDVA